MTDLEDKFSGCLLCGAIGDAGGWPVEFGNIRNINSKKVAFFNWSKMVGGKWWGYRDDIMKGDYSDDTQLTLAIARSVDEQGVFLPYKFAYEELPLWIQYERGGGRATKLAVRNLITKVGTTWYSNFYKDKDNDYRNAGANGAAMRCAPLVLINVGNLDRMYRDIFYSSIVTHGHPRALLGAAIISAFLHAVLVEDEKLSINHNLLLKNAIIEFVSVIKTLPIFKDWLVQWNKDGKDFDGILNEVINEAFDYIDNIDSANSLSGYISYVKADREDYRGSGLSSVMVAVYHYLKCRENMHFDSIAEIIFYDGIDTDTIGSMYGWLLGANLGVRRMPEDIIFQVQDYSYILQLSKKIFKIHQNAVKNKFVEFSHYIDKRESVLKIWSWEIGLYEMFWETVDVGSILYHPTLGRGEVLEKYIVPVEHRGSNNEIYMSASVSIKFDIGQTCHFRTRLLEGNVPAFGLAKQVERILT